MQHAADADFSSSGKSKPETQMFTLCRMYEAAQLEVDLRHDTSCMAREFMSVWMCGMLSFDNCSHHVIHLDPKCASKSARLREIS